MAENKKAPKKPKDHKSKSTDPEVVTAVIDGMEVSIDVSVATSVRLNRRIHRNDMGAFFEWLDGMFGKDNVDAIEDKFGLDTFEDWADFVIRVIEESNPN